MCKIAQPTFVRNGQGWRRLANPMFNILVATLVSNLFPSFYISSLQSIMRFDSAGGGSFVVEFDEHVVNG